MRLHFTYTNYRGETDEREVIVHHVRHMSTDWHPEKQWILTALDVKKDVMRDFAMKDMSNVRPTPTLFLLTADILRQLSGRLNELQNLIAEVGAGPTDDMARLVEESKKLLATVLKGEEVEPLAILPNDITPEIREVLRMQPWRVESLASALRAAGHNISKRNEDATAAVKFLLLQFVLRHGASWHHVFKKYVDGGVTDGMKYLHTLAGYEGEDQPSPGPLVWQGEEHARTHCVVCGLHVSEHSTKADHQVVTLMDYINTPDGKDLRPDGEAKET